TVLFRTARSSRGTSTRSHRKHRRGRRPQPVRRGRRRARKSRRVQQRLDRRGRGDWLAERADEYSRSKGFEAGRGARGGEFEARGGTCRGEKHGGEPGKRQSSERGSVFPREGDRESEQSVAARAAGFCEYACGL